MTKTGNKQGVIGTLLFCKTGSLSLATVYNKQVNLILQEKVMENILCTTVCEWWLIDAQEWFYFK